MLVFPSSIAFFNVGMTWRDTFDFDCDKCGIKAQPLHNITQTNITPDTDMSLVLCFSYPPPWVLHIKGAYFQINLINFINFINLIGYNKNIENDIHLILSTFDSLGARVSSGVSSSSFSSYASSSCLGPKEKSNTFFLLQGSWLFGS